MPGVDYGYDDTNKGKEKKRDQNVLGESIMEDHNFTSSFG
jgi:hypothetical protein